MLGIYINLKVRCCTHRSDRLLESDRAGSMDSKSCFVLVRSLRMLSFALYPFESWCCACAHLHGR